MFGLSKLSGPKYHVFVTCSAMLKMPNAGYCQRPIMATLMQSQLKFWSDAVFHTELLTVANTRLICSMGACEAILSAKLVFWDMITYSLGSVF